MFKKLKSKIEQGVAQSSLMSAMTTPSRTEDSTPESSPHKLSPTTPPNNGQPSHVPQGPKVAQLVDISLQENDQNSELLNPSDFFNSAGDDTPRASRSRQSSISSVTSDSPFMTPLSFPQQQQYVLPSDIESEMDEPLSSLDAFSKDDLYTYVKKYERKATRYKSKFTEVVAAFKDVIQERDKLKSNLSQSQDRAFRRISELREQSHLDNLAKRDLEENYQLMLDEKDELNKVLQMQVRLLKEGKEIPPDLEKASDQSNNIPATPPATPPAGGDAGSGEDMQVLREKIKHQQALLSRCKETINNNKEKSAQLMLEKENMQKQLAERTTDLEKLKQSIATPPDISKLQSQMRQARQVISQLESDREMLIAEAKQQMHEAIDVKDAELRNALNQSQAKDVELRDALDQSQALGGEKKELKEKLETTERAAKEQLDKSREIIRQLKEEKKQALDVLEEEKQNLVQELSRGKAAAIALMQTQASQDQEKQVKESMSERDEFWKGTLDQLERTHKELLLTMETEFEHQMWQKEEELARILQEKESEMRLSIEERDLQKMAALSEQDSQKDQLHQELERVGQVKIDLENQLMKLKEDHLYEIAQVNTKLELTNQDHETKINNVMRNHKNELEQRKLHFNDLLQEKLDAVSQKQREQLDNLTSKHEESLQGSNSEIESYYKTQVDTVKCNLEQLLGEKSQHLENVNQYAQQLKLKLSELQTELDTKSESYESRISEIQNTLKSEKDTSEKLESELQNWRLKFSVDQSELARHITDLKEQLHNLEVHKTHLEASNEKLKDELDELSSHWVEKHEALTLEKDTVIKEQQEHSAQQEIKADEEIRSARERLKELTVAKSDLENAKSKLEGKLSVVENTMQEILQANEDLNKNLEKSQQQTMKINQMEHKLSSLNDELSTMKSNIEEKGIIINSLETRCTELDKDAKEKSTLLIDTENHLKEAKEKFNMLRTEAKNKIKELKDDIECLNIEHSNEITSKETKYSEQLQAMEAAKVTLQQDLQAKGELSEKYRSNLVDLDTQLKDQEESQAKLEESFRIRFQERQEQMKAFLLKTKEDFQLKIKKMEDEYEMKVSDMLKQKDLGVEDVTASLETLKAQQMDELKARHKASLEECNEEWKTKTRQIQEESDSKLIKGTQDLEDASKVISDSQKQINQLSNDLEVQTNLTVTQTDNDQATLKTLKEAHQEQITELENRIAGLTKALDEAKNAITEQKECLLREYSDKFKELELQVTAVSDQLASTAEKHQCEMEEKSQLLQETTERISLLERTNASMEGMVDSLNESCKGKEETIDLIHAEYTAQLQKLSSDNRTSVADIASQLEERRVAITELERGAELMRDEHAKKVNVFDEERSAALKQITDEYEKKVSEMRTNDEEAQKALCDIKDKLSQSEESLIIGKQHESNIQELKSTLDRKESEFNEEKQVLNQKFMEASNQTKMSADKLQLMLEEEAKRGESKYSSLTEKHGEELSSMQTTWQTKHDELKQRYTAKLKEFKTKETEKLHELNTKHANILKETNMGIIELENKMEHEIAQSESLASELNLANNKLLKMEDSCREYSAQISELTTEIKDLQKTITAKDSEIEIDLARKMGNETIVDELNAKFQSQEKEYSDQIEHVQQASDALTKELDSSKSYCESSDSRIKELEMELKESSLDINKCRSHLETEVTEHEKTTKQCESLELQISKFKQQLDSRVSEHDAYIIDIQETHNERLRTQSTQMETGHNAKIAELKKKAETYITQMKKQLLDDKGAAIAQQVSDKEVIISEQVEKITLLETDNSSLNARLATVHKDYTSQAEDIIKLTEDYRDSEKSLTDIKNEKDELNLKIQQLESNMEMMIEEKNNEISRMIDSKSKLQKEFMNLKRENNENMEITEKHHQEEIARLKNEYENELQERDISNASRMKHLLKEVNVKMCEKQREFEESFSGVVDKGQRDEEQLIFEHKKEMDELHEELHLKDTMLEDQRMEYYSQLQDKEKETKTKVNELEQELASQRAQHVVELKELEEKLTNTYRIKVEERSRVHEEETAAMSREWNMERQIVQPLQNSAPPSHAQQLVHQNQLALSAIQSGSSSGDLLRQQVIELTNQNEELRTRHNLELAEVQSQQEMAQSRLPQPLVAPPVRRVILEDSNRDLADEIQNLELHNSDLQATISQINRELSLSKQQADQLNQKVQDLESRLRSQSFAESPPSSPYSKLGNNVAMGPLLQEATESEYLRNVLFQYMMGRETKTLAKVIATVAHFTDEQTYRVMLREEGHQAAWLSPPR